MPRVIPEANHALGTVVFIAQSAQAGSTEEKVFAGQRGEAKPAGGKDAQKMTAGKKQHVAVGRTNSVDHVISSGSYIGWRFTAWTAVAKELPIRPIPANLF